MAAEYALVYLGEIDSVAETLPTPASVLQPASADDFSSDLVLPTEVNSTLLRDFSHPDGYDLDSQQEHEIEPAVTTSEKSVAPTSDEPAAVSAEKPTTDSYDSDDDLPEELRGCNEDLLSQLIGKNPLTIIGEMHIDATYLLLARSDDPLNPMFAVAAVVDGETFRAAGSSKKLAKARAACEALRKLYNLEFGISESKICAFLEFCCSHC